VRWYARPEGEKHQLSLAPQLASWDNASHRSQVRLKPYLDATEALLVGSRIDGPWTLRLDVGCPAHQNLMRGSDLDNYAQPLAERLDDTGLMSVWCTKQYSEQSFVRIEATREVIGPPHDVLIARPTVTYESPVYKAQVKAAVADASMLPSGPVRLQLAFHVGPRAVRNWLNLWKPTIDALEPLLGRDSNETGTWNILDDRITELGLHLSINPAFRYEVEIGIIAVQDGDPSNS
jgi:hypothetical protein